MVVNLVDPRFSTCWQNLKEKAWEAAGEDSSGSYAKFWAIVYEWAKIKDMPDSHVHVIFDSEEDVNVFLLTWG